MKFACVSDLHGHLPDLSGLEFDVLLIGGDIGPGPAKDYFVQMKWFGGPFRDWLEAIDRPVVGVAGNHDYCWELKREMMPAGLPWTYLQDSGTEVGGFKVWGSPWQPRFRDWAFNLDEPELTKKWDLIPDDTDVLVLHGPPYGIGDFVPRDKEYVGSPSLRERIDAIKPKLVVYGHVHSGYGRYELGPTLLVNAALKNEQYQPVNSIQVVEIV